MLDQHTDTQDLVAAVASGDRKAFGQLFRQWYVRLCIYADSLLHDRDQAEDLVQNVFCVLWERQRELLECRSLSSYLYRSVYNGALNLLKHEKVKSAFLEFQREQELKGENNVEHFMERESQEELMHEVNRIIETLPAQCREIFMLSRFAGKKSAEIASQLNISVRTVETQLYRAMKKLREEMGPGRRGEILFYLFLK